MGSKEKGEGRRRKKKKFIYKLFTFVLRAMTSLRGIMTDISSTSLGVLGPVEEEQEDKAEL